jgi:hypothetical protein
VGVAFYNAAIDGGFAQCAAGARAAAAQIATLACAQVRWNDAVRSRLAALAKARGVPLAVAAAGERINALFVHSFSANGAVPAETAMHTFIAANATFHVEGRARRASAAAVLAAVAPTLRMQPIAEEAEALYASAARFMTEALLVLMYVKARGSAEDYLATAVGVLDEVVRFVNAIQVNLTAQRSWFVEQLVNGELRPLEDDTVMPHRFEELWSDVMQKCEQTRCCADQYADDGAAAPGDGSASV